MIPCGNQYDHAILPASTEPTCQPILEKFVKQYY